MTNAKAKIADFVVRARARNIVVGLVTDTKPQWQDCLVDYNNTRTNVDEKIAAMAIENEWYWWSYNNAAQLSVVLGPGQADTYSFTSMKANLLSKKVALNNAGILTYLYYGWPRDNGEVYNTVAGMDGSTVTGGSEISQLNGVVDVHMCHNYEPTPTRLGYTRTRTRVRQYTYPVDLLFIISAETAFSAAFLEGKNGAGTVVYPRKTIDDCYKYIVTNQSTNSPSGSTTYFNNETDANVQNFVNVKGITVFHYNHIVGLNIGNGPKISINAGPDINNNTVPGSVLVAALSAACDDGLPIGRTLTYLWSVFSGPSGGSFATPTATSSTFSYTTAGVYILRLSVTDGFVTSYDELTLTVQAIVTNKTLVFDSVNPSSGVAVTLSIADINGDQNGATSITRIYNSATTLTASVPLTSGINAFWKWQRDGVDFSYSNSIDVNDNSGHTFTAIYSIVSTLVKPLQITSNFPATPFTVSIPDNDGLPVGLTGTVLTTLHYNEGTVVSITAPATHPVSGAPFLHFEYNGIVVSLTTTAVIVADGAGYPVGLVKIIYDQTVGGYFNAYPFVEPALCSGGVAHAQMAVSGAGTFTYLWAPGGFTGQDNDTVVSGTVYSCTVTETTGIYAPHNIVVYTNIVVRNPSVITPNLEIVDATCADPMGSARVEPTGGTPPYTYLWSTGSVASFISAIAGVHSVVITDANGCTAGSPAVIGMSASPSMESYTITQPTCSLIPLGVIAVSVVNGQLPYTYVWTKTGDPGFTHFNSNQIFGLDPGEYFLQVTDDNSCTDTFGPFVIESNYPLVVTASTHAGAAICSSQPITLYIDSITRNGVALTASSILWSSGGTTMTEYLGYLPVGSYLYSVVVTTSAGCVDTVYVPFDVVAVVTTPLVVTLDIVPTTCVGSMYEMSVTGTGDYTSFVWMPNLETTTTITDLSSTIVAPTEFYVIGYGPGGCAAESNRITVDPAQPTTISLATVTNNMCNGAPNTGAIDLTVTGGCPPYTYSWTGPGGFVASTQDISGLISGVYTIVATDSLLSSDTQDVTVFTSGPIVTGVVTDSGCPGSSSGEIITSVTGGTAPYTYLWNNNATTANLSNIAPGAYVVTVTDANGCAGEQSFSVSGSIQVAAAFRVRNPSAAGNDGEITVIVSGGVGPFVYLWNTGETVDTIRNLPEGTYSVLVTDTNGCSCTESVTLFTEEQEEISVLTCCAGDVAYLYVWQKQNGFDEKAKCTMAKLKLLKGYIKDLCHYEAGTCLTDTQYQTIKEKAKYICKCCGCGDDTYDDTILP